MKGDTIRHDVPIGEGDVALVLSREGVKVVCPKMEEGGRTPRHVLVAYLLSVRLSNDVDYLKELIAWGTEEGLLMYSEREGGDNA